MSQEAASFAAEFQAVPWLLPPRMPALPWAGVHGFDELMAMQSRPAGGHPRSVALLLFNKAFAVMAQNSSECGALPGAAGRGLRLRLPCLQAVCCGSMPHACL